MCIKLYLNIFRKSKKGIRDQFLPKGVGTCLKDREGGGVISLPPFWVKALTATILCEATGSSFNKLYRYVDTS